MSDYGDLNVLFQTLNSASAVTDLVGTDIYNGLRIPENTTGTDTINIYRESGLNNADEIFNVSCSVNCRSTNYNTSREIATAVIATLNRKQTDYNSKKYHFIVTALPTLKPLNESDVYNTPLSVFVRRR